VQLFIKEEKWKESNATDDCKDENDGAAASAAADGDDNDDEDEDNDDDDDDYLFIFAIFPCFDDIGFKRLNFLDIV